MKINLKVIQIVVVLGILIFLFGFSAKRNQDRKEGSTNVEYTNAEDIYITKEDVNNLLIVKEKPHRKPLKDSLNLNDLEGMLNLNPMIAEAEVFQTITKDLGIKITQRVPLARVTGKKPFYIDKEGCQMPLSTNYAARVPLVSSVDSVDVSTVFPLLERIDKDDFLKKHFTGITKTNTGDYMISLREYPVQVNFGQIEEIDRKLMNFRAFYIKAVKDELLDTYSVVNLKFANQVVCTKKKA